MDDDMKNFWRDEPENGDAPKREDWPDEGLAPIETQDIYLDDEPEDEIESFVPTDAYRERIRRGRRHTHKRRAIWAILILIGVAILCLGGAYAYKLSSNPAAFFETQLTPTPEPAVLEAAEGTAAPALTPTPEPTPMPDPYTVVYEQADLSMMKQIVNVLIVGVDYAEERETWSGKHDYHADVMMVLAINFDENRVDLISLPRDTYANIPGVRGIYKLNAALNCGGGYDAAGGAGFLKCCETAGWMLGDIPVNYYCAVTMPAVKQLVDAVGGVDYDLEISFTMVGRNYKKGQQHLDGQGVLDYLRVRKYVQGTGDLNRINRQKQMMVALFKTMQEQNLLLKIPDIVQSFSGQLYTNLSFSQMSALALFAYNLSSENIGMYSMGGTMKNIFNWNFCLTNQDNRVEIIRNVYGVDVPRYLEYTSTYAQYRWADMLGERYISTTKSFTSYLEGVSPDSLIASTPETSETPETGGTDDPVTVDPGEDAPAAPAGPNGAAFRGESPFGAVRLSLSSPILGENELEDPEGDSTATEETPAAQGTAVNLYQMYYDYFTVRKALQNALEEAADQAERYRNGKSNSLSSSVSELNEYASTLKSYALELAAATGYSTGGFSWSYRYDRDSDFNEVYVDFR